MMTEDIEPQYAPLLDTEVACALLDVYELDGHDWRPAYDHEDTLIQLLVTEGVRELSERIIRPGRYRVLARHPRTKRMITRKDWNLRSSRRSSCSPGAPEQGGPRRNTALPQRLRYGVGRASRGRHREEYP